MACILLHADSYPDGTVPLELKIGQRAFGNPGAVAISALRRDTPMLEVAILRSSELPPVGRMFAALVAIVGRRGPGIYLVAVDGDRDVRRPVLGRAGHLRRKLHRELEPANLGVGKRRVVGELVLDEAAR